MKKVFFAIAVIAATVGCSRTSLVNEPATKESSTPISFGVEKQNITKAANLETVNHFNFGVWAWKLEGKNEIEDQEVMNNYLVGWSNGTDKGYDKTKATTWASAAGTTADHTSPWFYEGLGTTEYLYEGTAGFYKKTDTDYMSNNDNQYLRYWDLAYEHTNFYCYAPYNKAVSFEYNKSTHVGTMTFPATTTIRDGYEEPQNHAYDHFDRSLSEYMYATGIQKDNEDLADVTVPFKHMGAQLFIRFYEDIPGYKVEIIDLDADHGKLKTGITAGDGTKGIQAAPSKKTVGTPDTYATDQYYTTNGATLTFTADATTSFAAGFEGATKVSTPLMFLIPQRGLSTDNASYCPSNLTDYQGILDDPESTTTPKAKYVHKIIQEKSTSGTQKYSYSPTIYYPVAQPTTSTTGFTFHISYRIIAEDNKEVITVHNATVHVPVKGAASSTDGGTTSADQYITAWQPNVKYTYTFKITKNATGTTNPGTAIDPTDPTPSTVKSLYPIVFDEATIEDFTTSYSEYTVSEEFSN